MRLHCLAILSALALSSCALFDSTSGTSSNPDDNNGLADSGGDGGGNNNGTPDTGGMDTGGTDTGGDDVGGMDAGGPDVGTDADAGPPIDHRCPGANKSLHLVESPSGSATGAQTLLLDAPIDVGTTFVIEFWLFGEAANNSAPRPNVGLDQATWTQTNLIMSSVHYDLSNRDVYGIGVGGGSVVFGVQDATQKRVTVASQSSVLDGRWHHVAVQRLADGEIRMFVDGQLEASYLADVGAPDGDLSFTTRGGSITDGLLKVGSGDRGDFPAFVGYIDELRFSPTADLTAGTFTPVWAEATATGAVALNHFSKFTGTDVLIDEVDMFNNLAVVDGGDGTPPQLASFSPFNCDP